MRSPGSGELGKSILAGAVVVGSILSPASALAEAPHFFDDLFSATYYDPEFVPANRPVGYVTMALQAWSVQERPGQSIDDQAFFGEYRFRWVTPLEAKSALLVEVKGAADTDIYREDYVVKAEYIYRGLETPAWIYAGMKVPEETEFLVFGGIESMSYKAQDLFENSENAPPIAGKGYAEFSWDLDDSNPSLRLVAFPHTVERWLGPVTVALPFEAVFHEGSRPLWLLTPHVDINVMSGFARVDVTSGYSIELHEDGEQRVAVGLQASFGSTGL